VYSILIIICLLVPPRSEKWGTIFFDRSARESRLSPLLKSRRRPWSGLTGSDPLDREKTFCVFNQTQPNTILPKPTRPISKTRPNPTPTYIRVVHGLGWVGSTTAKVLKIWKDCFNAFKARLDKIWLHQAVKLDFVADLTGIGNWSEGVIKW